MTKSSDKPRNILLTMKEHNDNNVITIKKVYNALTDASRSCISLDLLRER